MAENATIKPHRTKLMFTPPHVFESSVAPGISVLLSSFGARGNAAEPEKHYIEEEVGRMTEKHNLQKGKI